MSSPEDALYPPGTKLASHHICYHTATLCLFVKKFILKSQNRGSDAGDNCPFKALFILYSAYCTNINNPVIIKK